MQQSLIGSWRMTGYEVRSEDGEVSYPGGQSAKGYLLYCDSGYFSAMIMNEGRSQFVSQDFRGGTVEELSAAAKTFVAYCGTYKMGGGCVTHHIELSLFPNWVGTSQKRFIEFEDGKLLLSTPPFPIEGKNQRAYLILEKVFQDNR